jgi:hypothetical protein
MKYFIIASLIWVLFSCKNSNIENQNNVEMTNQIITVDSSNTYGYWQIPDSLRFVKTENEILSNGTHLFYYDGKHVILSLFTMKSWMWKSEDDYYKLKAKWRNDSLFYLPPFGAWAYLANFDGNNFCITLQDTVVFKFEKVEPNEISNTDSAILKKRDLHNYNRKPTDN